MVPPRWNESCSSYTDQYYIWIKENTKCEQKKKNSNSNTLRGYVSK